ncbi:MAG TPA: response regulator [Bryobacteraceae bacterium]|jgi:DNA-binding response OmpR family regulator
MRVLIADDDRDQLAIREMLFERLGFEVLAAASRESALEAARRAAPTCAVVDLRLPDEESGLQLIRDLKNLNSQMHIFVLSGAKTEKFESLPERALVDDVFGKGTPSSALLSRLQAMRRLPSS